MNAGPSLRTVVIVAALVMSVSMGLRQCFGLFLGPVGEDLGVTAASFGFAVALHNLVWGVAQPFVGALGDRFGPRPVLLGCGALYAAGLGLLATSHSPWIGLDLGLGVLTETPALLAYVAQRVPEARLAPIEDPFAFARMQEFNAHLCATVHVPHAHRMRGHRRADDLDAIAAMQRKVPEIMAACFAPIETTFLRGPWVLGDRYSLADGYLHTIARWLPSDGVDPARFPHVADHTAHMAARPVVRHALARENGG